MLSRRLALGLVVVVVALVQVTDAERQGVMGLVDKMNSVTGVGAAFNTLDAKLANGLSEAVEIVTRTDFSTNKKRKSRRDDQPGVYLWAWATALIGVLVGYKITEHYQLGFKGPLSFIPISWPV